MKKELVALIAAAFVSSFLLVLEKDSYADPSSANTISLTLDKSFGARVDVSPGCVFLANPEASFSFSVPTLDETGETRLRALLSTPETCGKTWAGTAPSIQRPQTMVYPYAIQPREYQWSFGQSSVEDLLITALRQPDYCVASAKRGREITSDPSKDKGESECSPVRKATGFAFDVSPPIDKGEIVAYYASGNGNNVTYNVVRIPVQACEFDVAGPLPVIVAGASEQVLDLPVSGKTMGCRLPERAGILQTSDGSKSIVVQLKERTGLARELTLTDVPADLPTGIQELKLRMAGGLIGIIRANVISPITVNKLLVRYDVAPDLDVYGDFAAASGEASTSAEGDRFAVVSPQAYEQNRHAVINTAMLSWPSILPYADSSANDIRVYTTNLDSLRAYQKKLAASPPQEVTSEEKQKNNQLKIEEMSYVHWRISAASADVQLEPGTARDLRSISFHVTKEIPDKVVVYLELEQHSKPLGSFDEEIRTVLKLALPLATKARVESIPLPARDLLEVYCNDEKVTFWNGEVHAIREKAVAEGQCQAQVKDTTASVSTTDLPTWQKQRALLPLYGPQNFNVTVRRGGVESKQIWQFAPDPGTPSSQTPGKGPTSTSPARTAFWARAIVLGEPKTENPTDAYYTVEIRPTASLNRAVEYRNSTIPKIAAADTSTSGEITFMTRLRSRGMFALPDRSDPTRVDGVYKRPSSLRTYLSATVFASGFRMPASQVDLKSSSSSQYIQYVPPIVGLLWSFEPWDYDVGQNPCPLNPTFQFGGHFFTLKNGDVGFNPIVGLAATLPLIKEDTPTASQIGTKATAGAFFEWDTRDSSPHLLIGLSVNVGSLLSGK